MDKELCPQIVSKQNQLILIQLKLRNNNLLFLYFYVAYIVCLRRKCHTCAEFKFLIWDIHYFLSLLNVSLLCVCYSSQVGFKHINDYKLTINSRSDSFLISDPNRSDFINWQASVVR